ncbi:hypothetical protein ACFL6I_10125 [candidate division KSB1 bacterium]
MKKAKLDESKLIDVTPVEASGAIRTKPSPERAKVLKYEVPKGKVRLMGLSFDIKA